MGLQEGMGSEADEFHGKGRIRVPKDKHPKERDVVGFRSIQNAKPLHPVCLPEFQPFMELFHGNIKTVTELLNGTKTGEVFPQDKKDKEQTVAGIGDNDIRKDGMGMPTAVAEYPHDTEVIFLFAAGAKVNDGSAVIIVDMAVSGAPTYRTGLQFRLKQFHVGVKKRF